MLIRLTVRTLIPTLKSYLNTNKQHSLGALEIAAEKSRLKPIRGFQPPYLTFISDKIKFLYEVSVFEPNKLWTSLENFVIFLPLEVKKIIKPKMSQIAQQTRNIRGIDRYLTRRRRNRFLTPQAQKILDQLIVLLEQKGYLEQKGVSPRYENRGKTKWSP